MHFVHCEILNIEISLKGAIVDLTVLLYAPFHIRLYNLSRD